MITVMGAAGNTGSVVAGNLLAAGKKIRVIGRSPERLRPHRERGAETAVGDAQDAAFLTSAFLGAESVYAMVPPDLTQSDLRKYYGRFGEAIERAVRGSGVRRMVFLSSLGGEQPGGPAPSRAFTISRSGSRRWAWTCSSCGRAISTRTSAGRWGSSSGWGSTAGPSSRKRRWR